MPGNAIFDGKTITAHTKRNNMTLKEVLTQTEPHASLWTTNIDELQKPCLDLCWEFNQSKPGNNAGRLEILKQLFGTCHDMTIIEPTFRCDFGFNIHTHGRVIMNYNVVILDTSPVHIGHSVYIAPGVVISCAGHAIHPQLREEGVGTSAPITIEKGAWIGANAFIGAGVTIGENSIIGAGSVVTKSIPPGVIAVGNPCRILREITEEDRITYDTITD
jgi:maltose O-acetyltransferase